MRFYQVITKIEFKSQFRELCSLLMSGFLTTPFVAMIIQDDFLFFSDYYSLLVVNSLFTLLFVFLIWCISKLAKINSFKLAFSHSVALLAVFLLDPLVTKYIPRFSVQLAFLLATYLFFFAILMLLKKVSVIATAARVRVTYVGYILALVVLILPYHLIQAYVFQKSEPPLSVIMLVLDGLPKDYIRKKYLDDIHKLGYSISVFNSFRTNYSYTLGYFNILYTGDFPFRSGFSADEKENLLSSLQDLGVSAQYTTFHTNGVPESNFIKQYGGLRSYLLTQNYAWFPDLLRLNSHTLRFLNKAMSFRKPTRMSHIIAWTNSRFERKSQLSASVLSRALALESQGRPYFLLSHTNKMGDINKDAEELWGLEVDMEFDRPYNALFKKLRANSRRYEAEDQHHISKYKEIQKNAVDIGFLTISELLKNNTNPNTTVIITSDHGQILDRGKVFYGVHPDEIVNQVPFLVLRRSAVPVITYNSNNYDTLDLRTSLLEYFGAKAAAEHNSIFSERYTPKTIKSLTVENEGPYVEKYLSVYKGDLKILYNIHPKRTPNTPERQMYRVKGLEEHPIEWSKSLEPELAPLLKEVAL